jgi:hypothetical protein
VALALACTVVAAGCSDIGNHADATVSIQAKDTDDALQLRQKLLSQAQTWGGARIGEQTDEQDGDVSLTFSLPGRNLDGAIDAVRAMGAQVDSTSVDVNREEIDRTTSTKPDKSTPTDTSDAHDGEVTLQVKVTASPKPAGAGAALRLIMAIFSLVGMAATTKWVADKWRQRFGHPEDRRRARRRVGEPDPLVPSADIDLSDPPTQETPRVPRGPWN